MLKRFIVAFLIFIAVVIPGAFLPLLTGTEARAAEGAGLRRPPHSFHIFAPVPWHKP
jgi:hypothetical protein